LIASSKIGTPFDFRSINRATGCMASVDWLWGKKHNKKARVLPEYDDYSIIYRIENEGEMP